jgi:hypothetical protein
MHRIKPRLDCKACRGEGWLRERHPYGSTTATEYLYCDCVTEQMSDDEMDGLGEIEIDNSEYWETRNVED